MFAVIKTGGKQYRVAANDIIDVERVDGEAGDSVAFGNVLMVGDDNGVTVGTPLVEGATVAGEVVTQRRTRRIIVFKKRRRQNSRRSNGHRQYLTQVRITEILTGGKAPAKAAAKPAAKPKAEPKAAAAAGSDDLKVLSGVGPVIETKLHALGYTTFEQIANLTAEEIEKIEDVLVFKGRIEREGWVEQAKAIVAGKSE